MSPRRPRYSGSHPRHFGERYKEHAAAEFPEHTAHLREKGRVPVGTHAPVLLEVVLEQLDPKPGEVMVDCTLGYGGHASAIVPRLLPGGWLIGLDQDRLELEKTRERLAGLGAALRVHYLRFAGIAKALALEGREQVDGILADLGVSSMQLDDPSRGFSVKHDGPLDLRMDARRARTAADLVRELSHEELAALLRELADEPDAEAIAAEVVRIRSARPIVRTLELVDVVLRAKRATPGEGTAGRSVHPAARTFQALRMSVNDELAQLKELLRVAPLLLAPGGRMVVVSFHSGEDRLVKESFRRGLAEGVYETVSDEPERASAEERRFNSRSASAKLRCATRRSERASNDSRGAGRGAGRD